MMNLMDKSEMELWLSFFFFFFFLKAYMVGLVSVWKVLGLFIYCSGACF
jgi:hypothetical protein